MLLPIAVAEGIRTGTVTAAYRRWEQPRVRVGGRQLTAAGVVRFDAVDEVVDPATLTDDDARAAGLPDAVALQRLLASRSGPRGPRGSKGGERIFRVALSYAGPDPRVGLRQSVPDLAELRAITAAVAKLDAGRRSGPWTRPILEWIRDHPAVVSTELAALLQRPVPPMKADIRRLKALGLTESLRVGYRLSPRGEAYLASLPPAR